MAEYDDEIIIGAKLKTDEFYKELDNLKNQLKAKTSQIEKLRQEYSSFTSGNAKTKEQIRLENELNNTLKKKQSILDKINRGDAKDFEKLSNEVQDLNKYIVKLQNNIDKLKIKPSTAQSVRDLSNEINKAEREARNLGKTISQKIDRANFEQSKVTQEAIKQANAIARIQTQGAERRKTDTNRAEDIRIINEDKTQQKIDVIRAQHEEKRKDKELDNANKLNMKKIEDAGKTERIKISIAQQSADKRAQIASNEAIRLQKITNDSNIKLLELAQKKVTDSSKIRSQETIAELKETEKMNRLKTRYEEAAAINRERIKARIAINTQNISSREKMLETRIAERAEREKTRIAEREARQRERIAREEARLQERASRELAKLSKQRAERFGNAFKGSFSGLTSPISKASDAVATFGKRILSLGAAVLVFQIIRAGFRQFRDYLLGALQTNDTFVKSLNNIKSNLMVAFYPIYQSILPALNTLMSALVKVSAYLAQFISMLTGRTIQQSQAGAKALYEQTQAMKDSSSVSEKNTKSLQDQKAAFDKLGNSIKGSKKQLAAFDKLMVLDKQKDKKDKTPKNKSTDTFVFSPTTSFDSTYSNMETIFDKLKDKAKPTIDAFKRLGDTIKNTFGESVKKAGNDFYNDVLVPLGNWALGRGLPEFARITEEMLKNTNWENLNTSLDGFFKSLEPFGEMIGEGLLWFYENVLAPLGSFTIGEVIPTFFNLLKGALDLLKPILETAGDMLAKLYKNFLRPVISWTGQKLIDGLNGIAEKLTPIGNWLSENRWFIEGAIAYGAGIAGAIGVVKIAAWAAAGGFTALAAGISGAAAATWGFTVALLANPITWIVAAIAALIAAIVLVIIHWDEWKDTIKGFAKTAIESIQKTIQKIKDLFNPMKHLENIFTRLTGKKLPMGNGEEASVNWKNILPQGMLKKVPGFAQGAVLRGGDPMLAYLNDQPRGQVNVEAPLKTMVEAFNQALRNNTNSGNGNVTIEANGDISQIISFLSFKLKQDNQRVGQSFITGDVWI